MRHMLSVCGLICLMSLDSAAAYIGPGAGITAIGTVVALFGAILLAIVGFIWFPVKRAWARMHGPQNQNKEQIR